MTREDQRRAFGDDLCALCVRYTSEFDMDVQDLLLVLAAQMRAVIEADSEASEEFGNREEQSIG